MSELADTLLELNKDMAQMSSQLKILYDTSSEIQNRIAQVIRGTQNSNANDMGYLWKGVDDKIWDTMTLVTHTKEALGKYYAVID